MPAILNLTVNFAEARRGSEVRGKVCANAITRRGFLKTQALLMLGTPLSLLSSARAADVLPGANAAHPLNVVCVGGHPDDPESSCSGTLTRYAQLGHKVTVIYLTRGERGIANTGLDEAARIRSAECAAACKIIGAKPVFAGQVDGATEFTRDRVEQMRKLLAAQAPDILFTHWPVDTHMDHQVASMVTIRAWMALPHPAELYLFEVNTGSQSEGFHPDVYVDVTPVLDKKKAALLAHRSQGGEEIWQKHHGPIAEFRGREAGVTAAEAFFHVNRESAASKLPGM